MSTKKTRRGRPRGTGIDDSAQLLQIAALMAEDPDLKPTTAIRRLGISEPSVIRRLRDKYKLFSQEQLSQNHAMESQRTPTEPLSLAADLRHDYSSHAQLSEPTHLSTQTRSLKRETSQPRRYPVEVQKFAPEVRF